MKRNMVHLWKPVQLDAGLISKGVEGLVGIEELTHYDLQTDKYQTGRLLQTTNDYDSTSSHIKKKKKSDHTGLSKKRKFSEFVGESEVVNETPRKKKFGNTCKKKAKVKTGESSAAEVNRRQSKVARVDLVEASLDSEDKLLPAWNGLHVPFPVLRALFELGFTQPTKIQALTLPAAILGRRDILGAAETGSGKTLAFGIPIIYGILIQKSKEEASEAVEPQDRVAGRNSEDEEEGVGYSGEGSNGEEETDLIVDEHELGCVKVVDNVNMEQFLPSWTAPQRVRKLYALVLTPTRELAVQVKNHLVAVAKYTGIKVAVVVGGMSAQKQERILKRGPEIVVATPGRLWELIQEQNTHLAQIDDVRYLAIDETDRMLERGHFAELQQLLERLNLDKEKVRRRQNFVFSATLTLVHDPPRHIVKKKGGKAPTRITPGQKLSSIIQTLGITNPKVVDVTNETGTAEMLSEACIHCELQEKDMYLYYLLQKHAGRTLVFCNSIGCVRRLAHLLGLLRCRPLPLHANMVQRQRLKNLDRFRDSEDGLLLATDVAARGLDIPGVEHVIHYQVPRTSESYVHRSGRTARAQHAGITILLIEPLEVPLYSRLCRTLGRDQQLPQFPVVESYMVAVKERVLLAREVDRLELTARRTNSQTGWLHKAAREMDIMLDSDDEDFPNKNEEDDQREVMARHRREVAFKRKQLATLLDKPIFPKGFLASYPSLPGKQQLTANENAVQALCASLGESKKKDKALGMRSKKRKKRSLAHVV